MSDLDKAIRLLEKQYEIAKGLDYVRNPIAYALYHTWREFDIRDEMQIKEQKNGKKID